MNDLHEAIATIAVFFQQGGTARSCDENMGIKLFEKSIKLAKIRKILKKNFCNRAERKLARTFANEIQKLAFLNRNFRKFILKNTKTKPWKNLYNGRKSVVIGLSVR